MNFQQRYLRLDKEIKNIKESQSKVVLDLRSVVYTSTQTMQYDHYWGTYSYLIIYFEDENGNQIPATDFDFMSQIYCTHSSSAVYSYVYQTGGVAGIRVKHPPSWATSTWTTNVEIITSKKIPQIQIYNSYTGQTTTITEGTII